MSAMNSRSKGVRGELEAAKVLGQLTGYKFVRVYGQSRMGDDAPDIDAPGSPWFVEVKLGKSHRIERALEQARAGALAESKRTGKAPRIAMVMARMDRGPWLVTQDVYGWASWTGEQAERRRGEA